MNREDYRKQYVWDGVWKPKFPAKRIVYWQDEVSCCAVKREDEEAFLSGGAFRTIFWDRYELIPETKKMPFGKFWNEHNSKPRYGYLGGIDNSEPKYALWGLGFYDHFKEGLPEPYLEVSDE